MVKNPPGNAGDTGSISKWGKSLGGGNDNLFQYLCWENSRDRGFWQVTVHGGHKESNMTKQHTHTHTHTCINNHLSSELLSQCFIIHFAIHYYIILF